MRKIEIPLAGHIMSGEDPSMSDQFIPVKRKTAAGVTAPSYANLLDDIGGLLESARRASVRAVNAFMTAT